MSHDVTYTFALGTVLGLFSAAMVMSGDPVTAISGSVPTVIFAVGVLSEMAERVV